MARFVLGFVGRLASGKAVCQKYLGEKYGAKSARFSTPLRDIMDRLYLPATREGLQGLSLDLRNRFGADILSRVIAEDALKNDSEIVVIDGVRRLEDISSLKDIPGFYLISIEADPNTRYERMKQRNENAGDAEKTYPEFLADENREAEQQIPETMAAASFHLDNNGDLENLESQLDNLIEEIKNK
ncbi:MAG: hypothetical protein ACM3PZ_01715 [Bacillota bacterium]